MYCLVFKLHGLLFSLYVAQEGGDGLHEFIKDCILIFG